LSFIASFLGRDVQSNSFRSIYYLGGKSELTAAIKAAIDEVDPSGGRVCDLFAGSCAVGGSLAAYREVTTVDVQEYSRVLCSAILNPPCMSAPHIDSVISRIKSSERAEQILTCIEPLIDYEQQCIDAAKNQNSLPLVELLESQPLVARNSVRQSRGSALDDVANESIRRLKKNDLWNSPDTTISRFFGGVYFSFAQARMLDTFLMQAEDSKPNLKDTLKAAALSTASVLVNTVGKQFAQPLRPKNKAGVVKKSLATVVDRDRSMDALEMYKTWLGKYSALRAATGKHQILRQDYLEAITDQASSLSVLYADPPYTRDHYSRFYHVLETMCLRDNPALSNVTKGGQVTISRGLYREDRHQSPFCIRSLAPGAFAALFNEARKNELPLVLSYSPHEAGDGTHPRVVSMEQIIESARSYFDRVDVCVVDGITHNMLNRSGLKLKTRDNAEILLKCYC